MDGAARRGRIARGKGIYVTEFGYQSNPPDNISTSRLSEQAQLHQRVGPAVLLATGACRRWRQYELTDVPQEDQFNTGLRFVGGARSPPTRPIGCRSWSPAGRRNSVEVYGQVRPARQLTGAAP